MNSPSAVDINAVAKAADRIMSAISAKRPVNPIRDLLGVSDIAAAYAVQEELVRRREAAGAVVVGRKIGLTSPAVQRQLGVDQPDFGVLFADMDVTGATQVPSSRLLQPKVEAEIAFILSHDLTDADLSGETIRGSVEYAVAALEIVDSRIANWDVAITDTVADNASSGLFVLGDKPLTLGEFHPCEVAMRMYANDQLASVGIGKACLGNPLNALMWLARTAIGYGNPLRAGQIILSGALGPMIESPPGTRICANLGPLGVVSAAFSEEGRS